MEETLITWNIENALTITFMAFIGFAVLGIISKLIMKARA